MLLVEFKNSRSLLIKMAPNLLQFLSLLIFVATDFGCLKSNNFLKKEETKPTKPNGSREIQTTQLNPNSTQLQRNQTQRHDVPGILSEALYPRRCHLWRNESDMKHRKLAWQAGKSTISRCMSYWKWSSIYVLFTSSKTFKLPLPFLAPLFSTFSTTSRCENPMGISTSRASTIFLEFKPGKHFRTSTPWKSPMNLPNCSNLAWAYLYM